MTKFSFFLTVVLLVGIATDTRCPAASEYLLEIVAKDGHIESVGDGSGNDLAEASFREIKGFNLILTKSLLFSQISYGEGSDPTCCKIGGDWIAKPCTWSRTLINNRGEVVGEYVREKEGDPWEEAEHTPWEEHTSAVISQSDQKSHILALVEKDSMLYGYFHSETYQWLVVAGHKAQYKGTGTVNGDPGYGFLLTAYDGQLPGGGGTDRFRIKIWELASGDVVYDNRLGASEDIDAAMPMALGAGQIVIHK